ncbi:HdeA/HdeB family chaperone [Edwardsiella piscicida]|uniref:Acid stress chaperone HdeB n=3 Tax=Edwardsiella TaxID=635 RepID=A0A0H3DV54_EDWTF|nr:HdeA/HdeB family chaperone [Edwardsiella piscicida]ACY85526.1 acid-resistance protein [Edwardsiella tarda EIB202]ADM42528.1 Protein hdeB precursor [Edwardsiella tarda FL6-60]AOP43923.1 acid-resistance protein [Edwardsiella piscicida]ARD19059.1 acid-resistance protein [Edwardsiella piscicida]EKS7766380.1 acid-resistance protein [Edwardsiella piscicida]
MKSKTTFMGGSVLALTLALAGNACAQELTMATVTTPETMTCHEFTQMNPKAMTPVMVWVVNKDRDYKNGDYVDWQKVQTVMVPKVIKVCKKEPGKKIVEFRNQVQELVSE